MFDPRLPHRFWTKVFPEPNGGCWLWVGAESGARDPYGKFKVDGRSRYAHRLAYEALVGEVPSGLQLDHVCRVRCCVNPAHLEPVTQRENILRGECPTAINALKTHCPMGHELTGDNLVANKLRRGERRCRTCKNRDGRIAARAYRRLRRLSVGA